MIPAMPVVRTVAVTSSHEVTAGVPPRSASTTALPPAAGVPA